MSPDRPPAPRCGWSIVCDRWPVYQLDRVQFRGAPVEHVDVCDTHLPHARAKGYRPPQPRSLPRPHGGG